MIVRISGEDQYELPGEDRDRLNELESAVVAAVEGGRPDEFPAAYAALLDYAYCVTAHKAQGAEWDEVLALEEIAPCWDAGRWRYTVATRARKKLIYFHNELRRPGHFLRVELEGTKSNRDGIGAVVYVLAGGTRQMRVRSAGSGFQSQSEATLHFGLGDATTVDELKILWPGGTTQTFAGIAGDQIVRAVEGRQELSARRLPQKAEPK